MSDAAPPEWVRGLKISDSGAWRCLVGLWGFAKYGTVGATRVWPSRATLAIATGQKPATIAKQLRKLAALGWIVRDDGVGATACHLAWVEPWSSTRIPQSSTTTVVAPDTTVVGPVTTVVDPRRPQYPQTFQGTSKLTSNEHSGASANPVDATGAAGHLPVSRPITAASTPTGCRVRPPSKPPPPPPDPEPLSLFGQDPEADEFTPAKVRSWWAEVFVPLRSETLNRYRPGSAQRIECSKSRVKAIRDRLADTCGSLSWTAQRDGLTHVVRNAAARVDKFRGLKAPWDWESINAIAPKHWLAAANFTNYYESAPMYGEPPPRAEPYRQRVEIPDPIEQEFG